jgi:hypothetical protein
MGTGSTRLWFLKRARIPPTDRCGKVERGLRTLYRMHSLARPGPEPEPGAALGGV